jgi:hypothetical protein
LASSTGSIQLRLGKALIRRGVESVDALDFGTPERVAGQRAACLPQAAGRKRALANNPQHT